MSKVSASLFDRKQHEVEALLARANNVYERLSSIWGNSRHDVTLPMERLISEIKAAAPIDATAQSFDIGSAIGTCDEGFGELSDLMKKFDVTTPTGTASFTYLAETQTIIDSFMDYLRIYADTTTSDEIYMRLMPKLVKMSPADIESEYQRHPRATMLYVAYLQHMMDAGAKSAADVEPLIERAKTSALVAAAGNDLKAPEPPSNDIWPLQRLGLIPAPAGVDAAGLIAHFFGGRPTPTATIDDFVSVAQTKKINVLLLEMISKTPIEYDISTLTDGPTISGTVGVNGAILKQFNNVRWLAGGVVADASASGARATGFRMRRHEHAVSSRPWAIARTLDGKQWAAVSHGGVDVFVPPSVVECLVRGPSQRVSAYNKLANDALAASFRPMPDFTEKIKAENKALVARLINRITGRIIQYVDKSLVPLPTAPAKLEEVINDPTFVEIMNEELLKSYEECGISANAPADEFVATFIADVDSKIMVQFARNLKMNMIELGPGAKLFREHTGEALRTRLYNIFVEIIKRSVSGAMHTKENIYEKLLIKDAAFAALDA